MSARRESRGSGFEVRCEVLGWPRSAVRRLWTAIVLGVLVATAVIALTPAAPDTRALGALVGGFLTAAGVWCAGWFRDRLSVSERNLIVWSTDGSWLPVRISLGDLRHVGLRRRVLTVCARVGEGPPDVVTMRLGLLRAEDVYDHLVACMQEAAGAGPCSWCDDEGLHAQASAPVDMAFVSDDVRVAAVRSRVGDGIEVGGRRFRIIGTTLLDARRPVLHLIDVGLLLPGGFMVARLDPSSWTLEFQGGMRFELRFSDGDLLRGGGRAGVVVERGGEACFDLTEPLPELVALGVVLCWTQRAAVARAFAHR